MLLFVLPPVCPPRALQIPAGSERCQSRKHSLTAQNMIIDQCLVQMRLAHLIACRAVFILVHPLQTSPLGSFTLRNR